MNKEGSRKELLQFTFVTASRKEVFIVDSLLLHSSWRTRDADKEQRSYQNGRPLPHTCSVRRTIEVQNSRQTATDRVRYVRQENDLGRGILLTRCHGQ